jgi:hypothetical protein
VQLTAMVFANLVFSNTLAFLPFLALVILPSLYYAVMA